MMWLTSTEPWSFTLSSVSTAAVNARLHASSSES
jgi:hypothetical protein